jgi:phosphoribosylformylglycinamidine cyclo-ligase
MAGELDPLTYKGSGVNYDLMDPFKIACQQAAAGTGRNFERFEQQGVNFREIPQSRGESSYRFSTRMARTMEVNWAHVGEGIGSKNEIANQARELGEKLKIADEARAILGRSFYRGVGIDNGATILNDLSASGSSPVSFSLFVAAGSSNWFEDAERNHDLIAGTADVINLARCSWGGGESQTLVDMLAADEAILCGSGVGVQFPELNQYPSEENLRAGQRIVLVGGTKVGAQTNGFSLLRRGLLSKIAQDMHLPEDKRTEAYSYNIGNGQTYGEAVLTPSEIYSPLMDRLLLDPFDGRPIPVAYAAHISGHGWAKIMRGRQELSYVIEKVPEPHPLFQFIQEFTGMSTKQMYQTYNMGAGYAVFVEPEHVEQVVLTASRLGQVAIDAGVVEYGPKRVVIRPLKDLTYLPEDLQIK